MWIDTGCNGRYTKPNQKGSAWLGQTQVWPNTCQATRTPRTIMDYTLNAAEMEILFRQDPATQDDGGWQRLLVTLQELTDRPTGDITIPPRILERIQRYAFDYGNGGWEGRLRGIFERHLGPTLGR